MKSILFTVAIFTLSCTAQTYAQGCVAIRGNAACSAGMYGNSINLSKGEFNAQLGYRYFKSFRHFRGDEEETHRIEEGTEVINKSSFIDLSLGYGLTDRLFTNLVLPFSFHIRSSMYEHGGNPPNGLGERHTTTSSGLSDMRLEWGYWLFDPSNHFNYSLALGVKIPTGNYRYMDTFYNQGENDDQDIEKVVDQSIQPGDGGIGITASIQGLHSISTSFALSSNVYYLFNFQNTNGQLTRNGSSEFSCPDQFSARIGAFYVKNPNFNVYLGCRVEGVPANDLIGKSEGYRRPGYVVSAEPGLSYTVNRFSVIGSVPIALYRNRTRSFLDIQRTEQTGEYRHGDAAFADYLLNISFSYRFGGSYHMPMEMEEIQ